MEEKQEKERKETIVWKDKEKCVVTIKEDRPIKTEKEVIGRKVSEETYHTTKTELLKGIEPLLDMVTKGKAKLDNTKKQLDDLGKKPFKTPELVKLDKNLTDLMKIRQINQLEEQSKNMEEAIETQENQYNERKALINTAPK